MVFTLPPQNYNISSIGVKYPDLTPAQDNIVPGNRRDVKAVKETPNIFNLQFIIILENIANNIILILGDIFKPSSYRSLASFINIFSKGNRLFYSGLFIIFCTLFTSFFFH